MQHIVKCCTSTSCCIAGGTQSTTFHFIMFCWPKASSTLQATSGGTPLVVLLHWRSQCSISHKEYVALHLLRSSRCSTVRCLHLTVNLQWKLFIFTPKRSFGVKTYCSIHLNLRLRCLNWSSPYGLDQYTYQALRPDMCTSGLTA